MEINCGECDNAVDDLMRAISACDPSDAPTLTDLLQKVLKTMVGCHGRDSAAAAAQFFDLYAQATAHDSNRIAADWMKGMAYGVGQYFSAAIALFDSIASLNIAAPFDSASAHAMAAMYQDMMNVEGDKSLPSSFGKQVLASNNNEVQPKGDGLIFLQVIPNPFPGTNGNFIQCSGW